VQIPPPAGVIREDPQRCHGCGICELVCALSHDGVCGPTAASIRILRDPLAGVITVQTCRQCSAPDCYFACPVDAIVVDDRTGARRIIAETCVSCGNCATACPFNAEMHIVKPSSTRASYVKCDLCCDRGGLPLCVDACPWEALRYVTATAR
jgi:Fe-S-cluster-containing hydrogenase component 2